MSVSRVLMALYIYALMQTELGHTITKGSGEGSSVIAAAQCHNHKMHDDIHYTQSISNQSSKGWYNRNQNGQSSMIQK